MEHTGFVNENAQYSFAQSVSLKNISDGNRFSSLKAKNILRVSVIPSLRKTSREIITHFKRGVKGRKKEMKEEV